MPTFDFFGVAHIAFGRGQVDRLPDLVAALGSSALLVHNADAVVGRVQDALAPRVRVALHRQTGEPTVDDVDRALDAARSNGCDVVVGLGGGSAIDAAKAVAGLLTNGGVALDYMEVIGKGQKITRPAAPWVAVPTTAGTGAEVTRNAVIGHPGKRFKASIRSEHLLPRAVVVDPLLGVSVRPDVTARAGMDALCQLIESYTSTGANPITDGLALQGITLAARSLRQAYTDGTNLPAREDMAMAALLSGVTLTNAGLGAVHGFAAPLGANFPATHGAVCAVLLPPVIRANVAALRASPTDASEATLTRYATIGRTVAASQTLPDADAIAALVAFVSDVVRDLQIPPLGAFGLTPADVPAMVALARKASSMRFNSVALSDEVLGEVLTEASCGETGRGHNLPR